jgi:hypothetical protein
MEERFGRQGTRFMDACDRQLRSGMHNPEQLYRRLAKIPEMARLVSAHQYAALYVDVARWIEQTWRGQLPPKVIDFGCGFGLLTALLARLHPESQFIGVDCEAYQKHGVLSAGPWLLFLTGSRSTGIYMLDRVTELFQIVPKPRRNRQVRARVASQFAKPIRKIARSMQRTDANF